ncbi:bifunctional 3-(3-hydroxy-phenyl)propionate/3-hydroxycinnamic acid hydroxylase [Paraburkholderia panacisoli]|uniref:Bifunctional 3-(3-hydroxy-phenyl)propionate/3-hydroxycinnamic acid hydroxylase n=1 Tax=Paraburkholderia panacisoli TaxID=2603818 RepID=A0A5B0G5Y6_9BURK|nr:bifunctional 3-(3-hydroxy-phenyl)propionate/3-hydroxycinnamic acid hydroxylase [Paraburkholderia panacisoli]KAA0998814.1 bifunctional 3-(3-hydroxy-phenyl)propionate/3-hydroxycinnamic acid hydroxylase [Paraburkholderia panacisoli]
MSANNLDTIETGVLIVGGGPTGLTLANVLGHSDVPFMLIDLKPSTIGEPRAVSIDDESLRTMQAVGLADPVMRDVVPGYGVHYLSRAGGSCFGKVEPTASEYGFPRRNAFRQPLFEATLRRGLDRFTCGATLFGHTLESFEQDGEGVIAVVSRTDGSRFAVKASFLVACDGGRSPVREKLGVKLVGSTFKSRWLVIDTEKDTDPFSQMRVYCDPKRAIVDVPGPHNTRRYEILIHPGESSEDALKEERIAQWLRPLRGDAPMDLIRKTVYTFHARVAERWQIGRIFLAGDAAHLTPPYAGQGMNSGVRDAHNLGWKLTAVLKGRLPATILSSYEEERRKHAWALIRLALNLGIVMAPGSQFSATAFQSFFRLTRFIPPVRDFFMQMKFKPKPRFESGLLGPRERSGRGSPRGRMLPQPSVLARVSVEGATALTGVEVVESKLDDVIGHRFALVQYGNGPDSDFEALNHPLWDLLDVARVRVLPAGSTLPARTASPKVVYVVDTSDVLPAWLGRHAKEVLVVRPDRYVAGTFAPRAEKTFADAYASTLGVGSGKVSAPVRTKPAIAATSAVRA